MLYDDDGEGLRPPMRRPAYQAAGCFKPASVYVVIKESDINVLNLDMHEKQMVMERIRPAI